MSLILITRAENAACNISASEQMQERKTEGKKFGEPNRTT